VIVMTAVQDSRPRHRPGAGERSASALKSALRAFRHVNDEQMRMWEAFRRVGTQDTGPEALGRRPPASPG
jgi:hypothetical protein